MRAYVINLDRAADRWEAIRRQAEALGFQAERVPAIDGRTLPDRPGHPLNRGEIACALSHREAWKRIAEGDQAWGAVFEDDVHVAPELASLMALDALEAPADVIKIETYYEPIRMRRKPEARLLGRGLHRLSALQLGAAGYLLSRPAARRLVELIEVPDEPIDHVIFDPASFVARELRVLQMSPALCAQDTVMARVERRGVVHSSNIDMVEDRRRPKVRKPVHVKVWREVSRPFRLGFALLRDLASATVTRRIAFR